MVALFGVERGPFNAYTLPMIIFVTSLHTYPSVFLLVSSALEAVDASMEQAAQIRKAALGERHSDYTDSLGSLATVYEAAGAP